MFQKKLKMFLVYPPSVSVWVSVIGADSEDDAWGIFYNAYYNHDHIPDILRLKRENVEIKELKLERGILETISE